MKNRFDNQFGKISSENKLQRTNLEMNKMSPKRRFLHALLGGKSDRIPAGNVVSATTIDQMRITDSWFPEAHTNPQRMACLAAASYEILGFDTVMPVFSVVQEAAALGCEINWGTPQDMPTVRSHPFESQTEF